MLGATTKPPTRRVASDANASPPRFAHHAGEGTAVAADASASQVRAFIDTALSAVADQKRSPSADLEFAVFRSGTQSPPFNPHQVGTDEWYAHGQRTGFWVNLKTSERFVDRPLMRSVLRTLVDQLQAINDMLAKMATGGVAKADVQAVARSVLSETSLTEADLDNEPASVKDRAAAFGGLYAHMFILDDRRFYSDIVEDLEANGHPVAGRKRRVQSWGQAALQHMTDYMNDQDIETPDADERRSDAFRDVMRGFDDVGGRDRASSMGGTRPGVDVLPRASRGYS